MWHMSNILMARAGAAEASAGQLKLRTSFTVPLFSPEYRLKRGASPPTWRRKE
jgi:hypothetical protein